MLEITGGRIFYESKREKYKDAKRRLKKGGELEKNERL